MEVFLAFYKFYSRIKITERSLLSYGFLFFKDKDHELKIFNEDIQNVQDFCEKREGLLKNWKQNIEALYEMSANGTMLKGEKLKSFYLYLIGKSGKSKYFRYLCSETIL